jgi:hypothetical protein
MNNQTIGAEQRRGEVSSQEGDQVLQGLPKPNLLRHKLVDILAEMPEGLPRVEGWDAMPSVGQENLNND